MKKPPYDLCADLRNDPDAELRDDHEVCTASNRQLRLYVAAYMLAEDGLDRETNDRALRQALHLYEYSGRPELLDAPGRLTTAGIAAEVLSLHAIRNPTDPINRQPN